MSTKKYKNNQIYNVQYGSIPSTTTQKAYQCTFGGTIDEHSFLRVTYTNVKEKQNEQDYFKGSSKVKVAEFSAINLDGILLKDFEEVDSTIMLDYREYGNPINLEYHVNDPVVHS